jgi:beta-phosphoglucomutase-like phosphatase (HAD superfamily)
MIGTSVEALLCDADGNLFPSEEPAFAASAEVTNGLLADVGVDVRFTPDELRRTAVGRNFRSTAVDLLQGYGIRLDPAHLQRYVDDERQAVIERLSRELAPDGEVLGPLTELSRRFTLAAVSSSAVSRLDACFGATGLSPLFPPERRFSAEDSLPAPASKPDPAIYLHAARVLGVSATTAVAVEDAPAGVQSAVAAGLPVIGNLIFVAPEERPERADALRDAGAVGVVDSWWALADVLAASSTSISRRSRAEPARS